MSGNASQKLKLLYIADYLIRHTDEEHCASVNQIQEVLNAHEITSERKSIYSDIDVLRQYGLDIQRGWIPVRGYYIASRQLTLAEVRLLMDSVQSSPFITRRKSRELIAKLQNFVSSHEATLLDSQLYIEDRQKSDNEEIFYNIERIHTAITQKRKIRFTYFKRHLVTNIPMFDVGKEFTVSPYAAIWADDKYYLVGNYSKYDDLSHYRIDRMRRVDISGEAARPHQEVCQYSGEFDVSDYVRRVFNMYAGEGVVTVELECENCVLDAIIEKFGISLPFRQLDDEKFTVKVPAAISDGLVHWILNFGGKVVARAPAELVRQVRRTLFMMNQQYR